MKRELRRNKDSAKIATFTVLVFVHCGGANVSHS